MVASAYQMDSEDLVVNVCRDTLDNTVENKMVVLVNHVKIMVCASVQLVVDIPASVQRASKDRIVNKVISVNNLLTW